MTMTPEMWAILGTGIGIISAIATVVGLTYTFLRNFKNDINARMDRADARIDVLEERIFLLATGKTLKEAMLEQAMKKQGG
jgi:hypothetical protein